MFIPDITSAPHLASSWCMNLLRHATIARVPQKEVITQKKWIFPTVSHTKHVRWQEQAVVSRLLYKLLVVGELCIVIGQNIKINMKSLIRMHFQPYGVGRKSIQWTKCNLWVHKKCSGEKIIKLTPDYTCPRWAGNKNVRPIDGRPFEEVQVGDSTFQDSRLSVCLGCS